MKNFESSIIIPVYNKWNLTRVCLKNLAAHTPKDKIEVIVVDNASTDETEKGGPFLGKALFGDAFHYIRNDENRNFAGASNQGAEIAQGKYLIFLNNDTEVQPGWYEPLIDDFTAFPDIAATGPLLAYPEQTPLGLTVQHLGVFISPFLLVGHLHEGIPIASPLAKKRRFFQVITGACLVIPAALFVEAGKFDEGFINGFEDVDLCARLSDRGLRMTVNPASLVLHHESKSQGRHTHEEKNSEHLRKKSLNLLKPDWAQLVEDDGLLLNLSRWQFLQIDMPEAESAPLDAQAPAMDDEGLRETIIANPYWERGWEEFTERCRTTSERTYVLNAYPKFFPNPENLLWLSCLPWVRNRPAPLSECWKRAQQFLRPPEAYLEQALEGMKWCLTRRLSGFASQFSAFMRKFDDFCRKDFSDFTRGLWQLERRLGIPHPPENAKAYCLWNYAVDMTSRTNELGNFLRESSNHPEGYPSFSILMPVYNPSPEHLRAALDSILAQDYPRWELCIADDASTDSQVGEILREYSSEDCRIKVFVREKNGHIAAATNTALSMATNPWCVLMDQDDLLTPDALAVVAKGVTEHPKAILFFSDEDKTQDGRIFFQPYFKTGIWDWELLPVQNYVCHLAVYQTQRMRDIGGFREGFAGAQDHDFVLRYASGQDAANLVHLPHVLYHWRAHAGSTAASIEAKSYALDSSVRAAQSFLDTIVPGATIESLSNCTWTRVRYPLPTPVPSVSLVCAVPGPAFPLVDWYAAWAGKTRLSFEAVFVCEERVLREFKKKLPRLPRSMKLIGAPAGLSVAARLQMGAKRAEGEILGLVDASIVPNSDGWLEELISTLSRDGVGVAGGKVHSRDGSLANAGYMADASTSLKPLFTRERPDAGSYFGWTRLARTVDAVDTRCLFTKSKLFREVGGLSPTMQDWAGQDFCLRLAKAGSRTVWWPYAEFVSVVQTDAARTAGVAAMAHTWQGKLRPFNANLLALGPGLDLAAPHDKTYDFSEAEYLQLYPDVARSGLDPLNHYLHAGLMEGRKGRLTLVDYGGLTPERIAAWRNIPANGVVVCTSLCGDYEELLPPAFLNDGWRYVCYSDTPRNGWGIWDVRPIPYENVDPTRRSRWAKLNLPFLFSDAKWVFWLDANIVISGDISPLLKDRQGGPGLWLGRHPARDCVYQEASACVASRRDSEQRLKSQTLAYAQAGMPENFGMWENNCFLIDPASEKTRTVFAEWWKEYESGSRRDQLSLPFAFYKLGFRPGALFPDGKSARSWPALSFLTHEESRWIPVPKRLTPWAVDK